MAIKKLENGKYKTSVYDINGKRFRMTFANKAEANAFVSKKEAVKHDNKLVNNKLKKPRYLMEEAISNFISSKDDRRAKTVQKYGQFERQFQLFCHRLEIKYVDDFTSDYAITFRQALTTEKKDPTGNTTKIIKPKARTSNYYLSKARALFQEQLAQGHIDKNPMSNIKNLRIEKKPPEYYSELEIDNFFAQEMHQTYRDAFTVLLHSGMRFAELANLTWDDIDLTQKVIHVRNKDGFQTKTQNSIRQIPMNVTLEKTFVRLSENRPNPLYAISSVEGKKMSDHKLYNQCRSIGKKAGIKGQVCLHKFRHTFASLLVKNNTRIEVVQKFLGHSSIKETMVYAHVRPEEHRNDIKILDNLFNTNTLD